MLIELDDLKRWRAERIAGGNCDYDEMEALACFINTVKTIDIVPCGQCEHFKRMSPSYGECNRGESLRKATEYCSSAERIQESL